MRPEGALVIALIACAPGADELSIGAECSADRPCPNSLECTSSTVGGYCVMNGCASDGDCPSDSSCLNHDGHGDCVRSCTFNYCVQTCILYHERPEECSTACPSFEECNANRSQDSPAFCVTSEDGRDGREKNVCVPLR